MFVFYHIQDDPMRFCVSVKEREQEMYLNEDDAKGFKVVKKDLNGDTKDVA